MSYSRPLPTFPPGRPAAAAVPAAPSRAPRPPHPPLTQRMRTGHWIAIDCVVAAFTALFVVAAVHPYMLMHPGQACVPDRGARGGGRLRPGGAAPPCPDDGLRRAARPGRACSRAWRSAAAAVIFLAVAYALYAVTLTSSKRTGVAALGLVLALMVIITTTGRDRPPFVLGGAYAPVALANVLAWTVGLLGAAAPPVRGAVAAAGGEQRGRRRAAADRQGTARRGGAQHVGDRRAGRLRPVRHRRQPRGRARGPRRDPGHQQGSPR